jgi:hypothetical protein
VVGRTGAAEAGALRAAYIGGVTAPHPLVSNVDEVIVPLIPAERGRDAAKELEAFHSLSRVPARRPQEALQVLVDVAMHLTGSEAAGVSLLEEASGQFRWIAVAGLLAPHLNMTMPMDRSPCGTTITRGTTVVMRDPARFYGQSPELQLTVQTMMLVPFSKHGRVIGTLWVLSGAADKRYTVEDARLVESLLSFSSYLLHTLASRRGG